MDHAQPSMHFRMSFLNKHEYPTNIIQKTINTYPSALQAYKDRLDEVDDNLFETDLASIEVPIRDLYTDDGKGSKLEKRNIHSSDRLTQWLGVETSISESDTNNSTLTVCRKDPKSRFIYLYSRHSRARLKISRDMLMEILTFHQVMPDYLDFITVFGEQSWFRLLKFSGFREQTSLKASRYAIPELARSGRQYQLCFNLKGAMQRLQTPHEEWSIQEAAFYHRFDVVGGNALWIVTKGGLDIQQVYKEITGYESEPESKSFDTVEDCFRSSLSTHLMLCYWSTKGWRGLLEHFDKMLESETKTALYSSQANGLYDRNRNYTGQDVQVLQSFEHKINEAMAVLRGNTNVMTSLRDYYASFLTNSDFPLAHSCASDISLFINTIKNIVGQLQMEMNYGSLLLKITSDRKELVNKHIERQTTEEAMRMNRNMEREAVLVRIVTIVTLIYLPATFVSTVFSTDIIKYQGQESEAGTFSYTAMVRWLQVTMPLTFATLLFSWLGNKWAETRAANPEPRHPGISSDRLWPNRRSKSQRLLNQLFPGTEV